MTFARRFPELVIAIASAAWGLFWIPVRSLEAQGLSTGWITPPLFVLPFLFLTPVAILRWRRQQATGLSQFRSGLFVGLAITLYLQSLLLTDVARALILFYAMPAWGTLLEVGVMGRSLTRWRVGSLTLSVAGLLIIFGPNLASGSFNIGDGLALLSGVCFAIGAFQVRQTSASTSVFEQLYAFFFYGSLAALLLSQLPLTEAGRSPSLAQITNVIPWLLLIAIGFQIPVMAGIYWGSRKVDPGRLGILLQLEAIVGIGSAALWAGDPFGLPQAVGGLLVIGAGLLEIMGDPPPRSEPSPFSDEKPSPVTQNEARRKKFRGIP